MQYSPVSGLWEDAGEVRFPAPRQGAWDGEIAALIRSLYKTSPFFGPYSLFGNLYESQRVPTSHWQMQTRNAVSSSVASIPAGANQIISSPRQQLEVLIGFRMFFGSLIATLSLLTHRLMQPSQWSCVKPFELACLLLQSLKEFIFSKLDSDGAEKVTPAAKSARCLCQGPELSSQYLHLVAHNLL